MSIVDFLKSRNADSSFEARGGLYRVYIGDDEFRGTAEQNTRLMNVIKEADDATEPTMKKALWEFVVTMLTGGTPDYEGYNEYMSCRNRKKCPAMVTLVVGAYQEDDDYAVGSSFSRAMFFNSLNSHKDTCSACRSHPLL